MANYICPRAVVVCCILAIAQRCLASDPNNDSTAGEDDKQKFDSISDSREGFVELGKAKEDRNEEKPIGAEVMLETDNPNSNVGSNEKEKRRFDLIGGNSAFSGFGKRRMDSIGGNSAFSGFGKRRMDSIGGNSQFSGFGKRRFDSIGGNSAFSGFGKRRFDSIGSNAAFSGFGKRRFDSIGGNSAFSGFGKRRFDSIGGNSAFSGFGKRRFDSIGGNSAFSGFGKRRFDSIGSNAAFSGFGKRRFDSIGGNSAFSGFGKRASQETSPDSEKRSNEVVDSKLYESNIDGAAIDNRKKRSSEVESIDNNASRQRRAAGTLGDDEYVTLYFSDPALPFTSSDVYDNDYDNLVHRLSMMKRGFDRIGYAGGLAGFSKRSHSDDDEGDFARELSKRRFDRIGSGSSLTGFGKRQMSSRGLYDRLRRGFGKRRFDRIGHGAFSGFGKRRFDSIASRSSFAGFGR